MTRLHTKTVYQFQLWNCRRNKWKLVDFFGTFDEAWDAGVLLYDRRYLVPATFKVVKVETVTY